MACYWVLWHTRGEGCTAGLDGFKPAQKGSRDAGKELLRNLKTQTNRFLTDSETKTVTTEPDCGDVMIMHVSPSPDEL